MGVGGDMCLTLLIVGGWRVGESWVLLCLVPLLAASLEVVFLGEWQRLDPVWVVVHLSPDCSP